MLHKVRPYKLDGNKNPQSPTFLLREPFKPRGGGQAHDQCFYSRAFSAYLLLQRPQHPAPTAAQTSARLGGAPGSPRPSFCHPELPANALKPHGSTRASTKTFAEVQEASQASAVASTVLVLSDAALHGSITPQRSGLACTPKSQSEKAP